MSNDGSDEDIIPDVNVGVAVVCKSCGVLIVNVPELVDAVIPVVVAIVADTICFIPLVNKIVFVFVPLRERLLNVGLAVLWISWVKLQFRDPATNAILQPLELLIVTDCNCFVSFKYANLSDVRTELNIGLDVNVFCPPNDCVPSNSATVPEILGKVIERLVVKTSQPIVAL